MIGKTLIIAAIIFALLAIPIALEAPDLGVYIVIAPFILYGASSHFKLNYASKPEQNFIERATRIFFLVYIGVWLVYVFAIYQYDIPV
jgi:hypothetical protein